MFYEYLKQGIRNRNSVLNRVGKSAIFVLNRSGYEEPGRTSPPKDKSSTSPGKVFPCKQEIVREFTFLKPVVLYQIVLVQVATKIAPPM